MRRYKNDSRTFEKNDRFCRWFWQLSSSADDHERLSLDLLFSQLLLMLWKPTHSFGPDPFPRRVLLQRTLAISMSQKQEGRADLEYATLNHDLHTIYRNTRSVVYGIFEDVWWEIGVEEEVVRLSCVLNVYGDWGHGQ